MGRPSNTPEMVLALVDRTGGPEACWIWPGWKTTKGYGQASVLKRRVYVHRLAYEQTFGAIPPRLFVSHRCHERTCCNPNHLYVATGETGPSKWKAIHERNADVHFAKYVGVSDRRKCWEWTGGKHEQGYGLFTGGRAHRYAWEAAFGPIPAGLSVCHACDNPACVNPHHLMLGTKMANAIDRDRKGRHIGQYNQAMKEKSL